LSRGNEQLFSCSDFCPERTGGLCRLKRGTLLYSIFKEHCLGFPVKTRKAIKGQKTRSPRALPHVQRVCQTFSGPGQLCFLCYLGRGALFEIYLKPKVLCQRIYWLPFPVSSLFLHFFTLFSGGGLVSSLAAFFSRPCNAGIAQRVPRPGPFALSVSSHHGEIGEHPRVRHPWRRAKESVPVKSWPSPLPRKARIERPPLLHRAGEIRNRMRFSGPPAYRVREDPKGLLSSGQERAPRV